MSGKRGRPAGSKDKKPRKSAAGKMAAIAASKGITPLDLMLKLMRRAWDDAETMRKKWPQARPHVERADDPQHQTRLALIARSEAQALLCAEKAAPFIHPKRAPVDEDGGTAPPIIVQLSGIDQPQVPVKYRPR